MMTVTRLTERRRMKERISLYSIYSWSSIKMDFNKDFLAGESGLARSANSTQSHSVRSAVVLGD
jgi:hypothetical protein